MKGRAEQCMLELFASSTDGETIRRRWLHALMRRFDAQLGMTHNMALEDASESLRCTDVFLEGNDTWRNLEPVLAGKTLSDLQFAVEDLASVNSFSPCSETDLPETFRRTFLAPCTARTTLRVNVLDGDRFVGHVSVYRTDASLARFDENDMRGEAREWERATVKLMIATHKMLASGPSERGAMLFRNDGTPWMESRIEGGWASEEYARVLQRCLERFTTSQESEQELLTHNTRINLSRVRGAQDDGIVLVVEPMQVPRVSAVCVLSPTQRLVCAHIVNGFTLEEVAALLFRSVGTIKSHLRLIYKRLGIATQAELALLYEGALLWRP